VRANGTTTKKYWRDQTNVSLNTNDHNRNVMLLAPRHNSGIYINEKKQKYDSWIGTQHVTWKVGKEVTPCSFAAARPTEIRGGKQKEEKNTALCLYSHV
jgi:hypothetical protein